jgi:hypothetical protein
MSSSLAIAAVTTTLRHILAQAVAADPMPVAGAEVTTYQPVQLGSDGRSRAAGVNVYLYQVTPNTGWTTNATTTVRADGSPGDRPSVALDLRYLISCYGDDKVLEPQRLLGSAVAALAGTPVLAPETVADALVAYGTGATAYLSQSDLADQPEPVRLAAASLSVEDMAALWRTLGTSSLLSVTYTATAVLLH